MKLFGLNPGASEPAVDTGLVTSSLTAIYVVVNAIFPNLISGDAQTGITGVMVVVLPSLVGFLIRRKVWSPQSVETLQTRIRNLERELDKALDQ